MASVLVVEDDSELREMVSLVLTYNGFEVKEAGDGVAGLDLLASWHPDLIVLDVMMPRMDGVTMCRRVRQEPETAAVPIIMISGRTQGQVIAEGLAAGANKYMIKPMSLDVLVKNINELLPS